MPEPVLPAIDPAKVSARALRARVRSSKFVAAICAAILVAGAAGLVVAVGDCTEGDACISPVGLVVPVMLVAFFGLLWSTNRWLTTRRALAEQERIREGPNLGA